MAKRTMEQVVEESKLTGEEIQELSFRFILGAAIGSLISQCQLTGDEIRRIVEFTITNYTPVPQKTPDIIKDRPDNSRIIVPPKFRR